jgi:hypothetical protein
MKAISNILDLRQGIAQTPQVSATAIAGSTGIVFLWILFCPKVNTTSGITTHSPNVRSQPQELYGPLFTDEAIADQPLLRLRAPFTSRMPTTRRKIFGDWAKQSSKTVRFSE